MKSIILIFLVVFPCLLNAQLVNDFRVNTDTALSIPKYFAKISSNNKGTYVVVWDETGISKANVFAQIFNNDFSRVGNNFLVNTIPNLSEGGKVSVRKDGSFGIAWLDGSYIPYRGRIFFRVYSPLGIPISTEVLINDTLKSYNPRFNVGTDEQNRFIITFDNPINNVSRPDIFLQIVDSNGIKVGNNVKVNQYSSLGRPALGVQKNGGFLIAWEGYNTPVPRYDLFCQMYSANGTPIGNNKQVNDLEFDIDTLNNQDFCDIAVDSSGNFVIAFSETPYSTGVDRIRYQRFNNSGSKIGSNKTVGLFESVYISSDEVGNLIFLLSYSGSSISYIYNLRIDKNDNFIGSYFAVSTQSPNSSKGGSDVLLIDKKIVNVWRDLRLSNQPQIFLNVRSYLNPDSVVSVNNISMDIPSKYSLSQNYPNPFNPSTIIRFQLPVISNVLLKVYDAMGREIQTLVNGNLNAGNYSVEFNGAGLSSGIYFYSIEAGKFIDVKPLVLLK